MFLCCSWSLSYNIATLCVSKITEFVEDFIFFFLVLFCFQMMWYKFDCHKFIHLSEKVTFDLGKKWFLSTLSHLETDIFVWKSKHLISTLLFFKLLWGGQGCMFLGTGRWAQRVWLMSYTAVSAKSDSYRMI